MKHLEYKIEIEAPREKVWKIMLARDTYEQWVAKSWPNSTYEGKWEKGGKIKFASQGQGGTLAELVEVKPYDEIFARHIAVLNPDGSEDRTSDIAKGWIGITERYVFTGKDGKTTLTVMIETRPEWEKMFEDGWPTALQELKRLCEKQFAEVH